jgi:hypothetical protein
MLEDKLFPGLKQEATISELLPRSFLRIKRALSPQGREERGLGRKI